MLMLVGTGASGASSRGSEGNGGQRGVAVLGAGEHPLPSPREGRQAGSQGLGSLPLAAVGGERWEDR